VTNFDDVTAARSNNVIENENLEEHSKLVTSQPEIQVCVIPASGRRPSMTRDQMRKNVINEIINSERVFLGHLRDVIEVFKFLFALIFLKFVTLPYLVYRDIKIIVRNYIVIAKI